MVFVVYCEGGDCQSSLALARRLHDEGFRTFASSRAAGPNGRRRTAEEKAGKAGEDDGQE